MLLGVVSNDFQRFRTVPGVLRFLQSPARFEGSAMTFWCGLRRGSRYPVQHAFFVFPKLLRGCICLPV